MGGSCVAGVDKFSLPLFKAAIRICKGKWGEGCIFLGAIQYFFCRILQECWINISKLVAGA
jgi:hypothetical protein